MGVFIPRFLGAITYLVVLTVVGTIGYVAIGGWPWREALYMTVVTVTAVGFQEVRALSEPGRDFTMVLLAGGITGVAHPSGNGIDRHRGAETDRPDA